MVCKVEAVVRTTLYASTTLKVAYLVPYLRGKGSHTGVRLCVACSAAQHSGISTHLCYTSVISAHVSSVDMPVTYKA